MHSYVVNLFRIVIDAAKIKLSEQVNKEFKELENQNINETEKKKLFEKLIDKFGLYVPLELMVGGRIDYYFDGNTEEEINELHNYLELKIKGTIKESSGEIQNINNIKITEQSKHKIENLKTDVLGGNHVYKDDITEWIKSFNMDNLQIIEYKNLIPIYSFIDGLEEKLSICVNNYEEIVLQQINNLINKDFKTKEDKLFEGDSSNNESWEVGITKEIYNTFMILKKSYSKKISLKSKSENIISGELLKNFIICGWKIHTNVNSNEDNIVSTWERKKEVHIIGNRNFKFNLKIKNENNNKDGEIEWFVDIFCIHSDMLIPNINKYNYFETNGHYFSNCDCFQIIGVVYNSKCLYNQSFKEISNEEYFNKVSIEELSQRLEIEKKNKEEQDALIKKLEKEIAKRKDFVFYDDNDTLK